MKISKICTLTYVVFLLAGVLTSCQKTEVQPPHEQQNAPTKYQIESYILAGGIVVTELIAGQNLDVGDVTVSNDDVNIYVTYSLDLAGWGLLETHLHLATSLAGIPQTPKGNPIPGQFDYQQTHDMETEYTYTIPLTWAVGTELYIAAHASVAYDYMTAIEEVLPDMADLYLTFPYTQSYYQSLIQNGEILNGTYEGWCIEHDQSISPNLQTPYEVNVLSSYDDPSALHCVDLPQNLDRVNWILNQNFVGQQSSSGGVFTRKDVQEAIWTLVEHIPLVGFGNPFRVEEIVSAAYFQGYGFVPACGEYIAIIVEPTDDSQVTLLTVEVDQLVSGCEALQETAWAEGPSFPGNNWAMYFFYTVN